MFLPETINRFWAKVDMGPNCWNWTASTAGRGYGQFWVKSRKRLCYAHRFSWELHNLKWVPEGMLIRHDCDNPLCVNPSHLRLGTAKDNYRDMVSRGRRRLRPCKGECHGRARLTRKDVEEIRHEYTTLGTKS